MATGTGRKVPATSPDQPATNSGGGGTVKVKKATAKVAERSDSPAPGESQNGDAMRTASPSVSGAGETALCKHCKKQMPKDTLVTHSKPCLRAKQERNRKKREEKEKNEKAAVRDADGDVEMDDDAKPTAPEAVDEPVNPNKNSKKTAAVDPPPKKVKKRKAVDEASANGDSVTKPPTKKQKKKETAAEITAASGTPTTAAKAKTGAKPKGPVDVEKQCGVLLPNGAMCARSLTCKSHAMGAKRAVPGRSLPYDTLLAQYQKKNQAKLHKAALASGAPLAEDADAQAGPVDSDEEREAVMAGVARAAPRPLYERPMVSVKQRTQAIRMRETLSQAMAGNRGAGLFAVAPRHAPTSATRVAGEVGSAVEGIETGTPWPQGYGDGEGRGRSMSWIHAQQMQMQQMQQSRAGSMSAGVSAA